MTTSVEAILQATIAEAADQAELRASKGFTATDVEQRCLEYVRQHAVPGDADSVVAAMDAFGYANWMMNVGDVKGAVVEREIDAHEPNVMAEIGGYCGYSAVRFGRRLAKRGAKYFTFEFSPKYAAIATEIVKIAGLSDTVTIVVGPFADTHLKAKALGIDTVDMFFIDHLKELYLPDFKRIEASGLLHKGSVVVADNVISPGAPDYLEYVRAHPQFQSVFHETTVEYLTDPDGVEVSTFLG